MTFTLSQTPDSANLYLYPSGASWTNFTPLYGENWQNVDDLWSSPSPTDYVYSNTHGSTVTDMYILGDHTTESGTINYVQVLCKARSRNHMGSSNSTFGLLISDSTGTTNSINLAPLTPLTTSFAEYSYVTTTKPGGGAWTWAEIDHMCIGIESSSATTIDSSTVTTVYITGAGTNTIIPHIGGSSPAATNWESVDEVVADDGVTYIYATSPGDSEQWKTDSYTIPNLSGVCTGTINNVTITLRNSISGSGYFKPVWYVGAIYYGTEVFRTGDYNWYTNSAASVVCPSTGAAWTWANIDSLEIGAAVLRSSGETRISQCYATINYEKESNPTVDISQLHAVVNYTPAATTVTLNDPESISVTHNRNINRFLFPQGDYEVEDMGRASKTLTITGLEISSADDDMQSLKNMCHYGTHVTITGLSDTNLNTDYMIQNFSWTDMSYGTMKKYRWTLVLEEK